MHYWIMYILGLCEHGFLVGYGLGLGLEGLGDFFCGLFGCGGSRVGFFHYYYVI